MKPTAPAKMFLAAIIAVGFGWGALWSTSQGIKLTFDFKAPQGSLNSIGSANAFTAFLSGISPSGLFRKTMLFIREKVAQEESVDIMIGGDIMFDRKVRLLGERNGYDSLLAPVAPLFDRADIMVANLEGPITSQASRTLFSDESTGSELIFTFATSTARVLARSGIDVVSLANNHSDNFGWEGYQETLAWLDDAGVKSFGNAWNIASTERVMTKNGVTVAFVGYHQFQQGFDRILDDVRRLHAAGDFVIVMPHWGEEYAPHPTDLMREQAQAFVGAGADAIIGSHPHVIEDHDWIGAVPVFYSLGNLLFDQYFSQAVMKGNVVDLHLVKNKSGTRIDSVKIYTTSIADKKDVTFVDAPVDVPKP